MSEFNLLPTSKFIMHEGQLCLDSESIGIALGYEDPRIAVNKIYHRNKAELDPFAVDTNLVSTDGKLYNKRAFTEEGIYIISMLANTPKASQFRVELAKFLKEYRQKQQQEAIKQSVTKSIEIFKNIHDRLGYLGLHSQYITVIKSLHEQGYSKSFIARALGCSASSVSRLLKDIKALDEVANHG